MIEFRPLPSQEILKSLLDFNPETGIAFWRPRAREFFSSNRAWNWWNTCYAGTRALYGVSDDGYFVGSVLNKRYLAHRVFFKICHDAEPQYIDHINGNRADNRICNLRSVSRQENQKNLKIGRDNTSGVVGVSYSKICSKWHAYITSDRKRFTLGYFEDFSEAVAVRKSAEKYLGFHQNHGRVA